MKKRIVVKEPEYFEIEFADGTVKKAILNTVTCGLVLSEYESIEDMVRIAESEPIEFTSKLLQKGLESAGDTTSYEEVRKIVLMGGIDLMSAIFETINEQVIASGIIQVGE